MLGNILLLGFLRFDSVYLLAALAVAGEVLTMTANGWFQIVVLPAGAAGGDEADGRVHGARVQRAKRRFWTRCCGRWSACSIADGRGRNSARCAGRNMRSRCCCSAAFR